MPDQQIEDMVSIIIPTYNREKMLPITVESFIEQDYPNNKYEIIISDNNSTDNTRQVIMSIKNESPVEIKYILEQRQGVHYARNTAAKHAIGDILYFTDDDMIADKSLLKNIMKIFQSEYHVANATGRILPKWEVDPPEWILKYCYNGLLSLKDLEEDLIINPYVDVFSCHQAILRKVFFESGGFNPENTAGEWVGDGETGMNLRIRDMGYNSAYVKSAVIYHMIPSSRMTQSYINRRLANQGNCDSYTYYQRNKPSNSYLYLKLIYYSYKFCQNWLLSVFNKMDKYDSWRMARAYSFYFLNRVKYDYRLLTDSKRRQLVLKDNWL